ncbi:M1 family metallopeptidase [Propionicimonas sp.]|uniref:M1 family metallopeptidase n=1 Tax=Propionicimonas sp. TaxID=1955623 RepID=UPI0017B5C123|nr:M1 family metallopeptidase [Propionicimonas sp.]MBU3977551.1 M1 family metallopeptidase [Actinomycetota bacterium]MBA3021476.1 M1 family metallopeptidase [Propionicimonas sp.]MBU3987025.1 M1 family metallopeptidase [Actinomycetota bacterium]MBU4008846.1 M1 family metallopeptidase [Actinomycetota bacterium]MBU4066004.1 M1 family metallopeptidase [Actinomycetota bacterium]
MDTPQRSPRWLVPAVVILLALALVVAGFGIAKMLASPETPAAAPATPSSPSGPTGGALSSGDSLFPTIGNRGYDVQHYQIELDYHRDGSINAVTTITANAPAALTSFGLDLKGLEVTAISTDGRPAGWTRDDHKLRVIPAGPVHGSFSTKVVYAGKPTSLTDPNGMREGWLVTEDGATVMAQPMGAMTWFPNNNTPADKATFEITVHVPNGLEVAGSGDLLDQRDSATTSTWVWQQRNPIATYLAMISIGQYEVYKSTMTLTDGRELPLWSFIDPSVGISPAIAERLPKIIRNLESYFGPYPQSSSGIVFDRLEIGYSLETQNRPVITFDDGDWLLYHELAHQWFGDSLTVGDWGDIWLNEGFATYTEFVMPADSVGSDRGDARYYSLLNAASKDSEYWSPPPAPITDPKYLFSQKVVYNRSALTLWALRRQVGAKTFAKIVKTWTSRHRDSVVTTEQFTQLAEELSGKDLDAFFKAWLYTAGQPAQTHR